MNANFLLFHAECVNDEQDSVCHLILVPVVDGIQQQPVEYFLNPDAHFQCVMSGITSDQVLEFDAYSKCWPEIQSLFNKFDFAVCSAEGYSAKALFGTLSRLGVHFEPIKFCNAKAICRRSLNEVSYSLDYLCMRYYNDCVYSDEPASIAMRWADFALKGLASVDAGTLSDFLADAKISTGLMSPAEFVPSLCQRDYSKRKHSVFDPSIVQIDADADNPFYGMSVVFTGKMESLKRDDARAAVIRVGGYAPDRLTQDCDYLVVGVQDLRVVGEKGMSGKMKSAEKYRAKGLPIEIINEEDFIEMIGKKNLPLFSGSYSSHRFLDRLERDLAKKEL